MKIAVVSHGASGGGSERVATILANYLAESGNDVFFYAIHSPGREYYIRDDVHYEYCDIGKTNKILRLYKRSRALKHFLVKNKVDMMISFVFAEGLGAYRLNIKKIYSLRNDPNSVPKKKMVIINKLYKKADAVVFQTEDAKAFFEDEIRSHGTVIPNPIKPDLPTWDYANVEKTVIAAGRLTKQKNFSMLLEAFSYFVNEFPDYTLSICGEGELEAALKDKATELGIDQKVRFEGHITNLHDRMTRAQIYVSSSDYEGISNSMLEALAIGVPTICTDCPIGGARMFIRSGENGFLSEVGNAEDLGQKMKMLAKSDSLRREFSFESQKLRGQLDVSVICMQWKRLIEGI